MYYPNVPQDQLPPAYRGLRYEGHSSSFAGMLVKTYTGAELTNRELVAMVNENQPSFGSWDHLDEATQYIRDLIESAEWLAYARHEHVSAPRGYELPSAAERAIELPPRLCDWCGQAETSLLGPVISYSDDDPQCDAEYGLHAACQVKVTEEGGDCGLDNPHPPHDNNGHRCPGLTLDDCGKNTW